jgi:hypothetical protein
MATNEPKSLALLRILHIFQKHSDCKHPLKQEDIIKLGLAEKLQMVLGVWDH